MNPIIKKIDALYTELPKIECKGKCAESCGPILMTKPEWDRIVRRLGYEPKSKNIVDPCPMLAAGRCSVYHIRPMICRLWGIVETMPCPFGCKPDRYLTHQEGHDILRKMEKILDKAPAV